MRSRPGLVLRALRPGFLGCDKVGCSEGQLDVATSFLKSRHGKMASRRSGDGAELI